MTVMGQWHPVAAMGHWSARLLHDEQPGGRIMAVGVTAWLALEMALVGWRVRHQGRVLFNAWRLARRADAPLIVMADDRPVVFALPGWPGRVVATPALLRSLTPVQRKVVLAHEQAHLDARHDLHRSAVEVAIGFNPLLWRLRTSVHLASERWADEVAGEVVGDRRLVARTIGQLATSNIDEPGVTGTFVMKATGSDVAFRVRALLCPLARRRVTGLVAVVAAVSVLMPMVLVLRAGAATNDLFQRAEVAWHASAVAARA